MANILIVDDDEMQRVLLQSALPDHRLFFAENGKVALEVVAGEDIDLIVTDLVMPEINGLRFIREVRALGERIPIIAISGLAPDQLDLAQDYGANDVFFKPLKRVPFMAAVERCLSQPVARGGDPWRHR